MQGEVSERDKKRTLAPEERAKGAAERLEFPLRQPGGCRSFMRKRLAEEFPKIVDGFIKEAQKGSCPHVKLATELLAPTRKGPTRRKDPLTKMLEEMGDI